MASESQYADDPTATYRGYRHQALYCLFRLFDDGLSENCVIQPEGSEDLAVYGQNGDLIEVVQVKDYSGNLTASTFKPIFYKRISGYCEQGSKVAVKIASFGRVGSELMDALDNSKDTPQRTLSTLTKDREVSDGKGTKKKVSGVSLVEAKNIFSHVELVTVDEKTLTTGVLDKLRSTMTSGDPVRAFENLLWWLTTSAEKQLKLTRILAIEKISQLGRFLTHRAAHEHEWNISITPVEFHAPDQADKEMLKREFFQGGRVRAQHVAGRLDIPRIGTLQEIHESFQEEDVVVVRAASGQGKTTLAYRYLLDQAPSDFRYEVLQAADFQHARRMSAALMGHAEVIDVPTLVYVDVRPGDSLWVEFVRNLAAAPGIRILVTIREEDWSRSRVTRDDFRFVDLRLDFTEGTACELFQKLRSSGYSDGQLDFEDAWSQLGDRKTLFEFVYLTTQNERLTEKIKAQISFLKEQVNNGNLTNEELHLLRLVSVASAYEARLNLNGLVEVVGIPEPTATLTRFANEYLLRTSEDGRLVEGFHAIRSEIIADELTDPVLKPRGEVEATVVQLLAEDDLETFLLCSFSRRPESADKVVAALHDKSFDTWIGTRGTCAAMHWLGLKNYAGTNRELIDRVRVLSTSGWWFTLDWDLAQVRGKDGFGVFGSLAKGSGKWQAAAKVASAAQGQQTNKDDVFTYAKQWIHDVRALPKEPDAAPEFVALAEFLYWMGHLDMANEDVKSWMSPDVIAKAWVTLPIYLFADFACAVRQFDSDMYEAWLGENRDAVEMQIRKDASILALAEEDDCLVAHFIINLDKKESHIRPVEVETGVSDLAVERVEIMSRCLSGFDKYGTSGYGHEMALFPGMGDDSTKRMPVENIVMPWLPNFNALARGTVEYRYRPESWEEYFGQIRSLREKVVDAFADLQTAVKKVGTTGAAALRDTLAWDECKKVVNADIFLPKNSVDEWGYVTESRVSSSPSASLEKKFSAISTLDPLTRAINEYTRTVGNFMEQSIQALVLVPSLKSADTEAKRKAVLDKAEELGVSEGSVRLSVLNGIDACIAVRELHRIEHILFDAIGGRGVNEVFRTTELRMFVDTMTAWAVFCFPEQILPRVQTSARKRRENRRRLHVNLKDSLKPTSNRIRQALKDLASDGINAQILSDSIQWELKTALWISFDTSHPLRMLIAVEKMWHKLVSAFEQDRSKIVRLKAIDWFWKKTILVPLVQGRSLERQAFANMDGAVYAFDSNVDTQLWRFAPEPIPDDTWAQLGLNHWEPHPSWTIFDQFITAYQALFIHVNHIADFSRYSINLDELGEGILQKYVEGEQEQTSSLLQETLDSSVRLLNEFPKPDLAVFAARPNVANCMNLFTGMKDAMLPKEDSEQHAQLTITEIAAWRDRLKAGFDLLGEARCLWIADSLGFKGFDYPDA